MIKAKQSEVNSCLDPLFGMNVTGNPAMRRVSELLRPNGKGTISSAVTQKKGQESASSRNWYLNRKVDDVDGNIHIQVPCVSKIDTDGARLGAP